MTDAAFLSFIATRRKDLRRISGHTRGEHSPEDVQAEAWLMAEDFRARGAALDLSSIEHQETLLSHLYQHLVRYTELNVRHAVRLDHAPSGDAGESHPLAHLLAADEGYDPLVSLLHAEDDRRAALEADLNVHQSLASAYVCLLGRFGNRMVDVARHLMISLSYSYRRCAHARLLAVHQQALPASAIPADTAFVPGAWRRFRLERVPVQLSFDFDAGANLFGSTPG